MATNPWQMEQPHEEQTGLQSFLQIWEGIAVKFDDEIHDESMKSIQTIQLMNDITKTEHALFEVLLMIDSIEFQAATAPLLSTKVIAARKLMLNGIKQQIDYFQALRPLILHKLQTPFTSNMLAIESQHHQNTIKMMETIENNSEVIKNCIEQLSKDPERLIHIPSLDQELTLLLANSITSRCFTWNNFFIFKLTMEPQSTPTADAPYIETKEVRLEAADNNTKSALPSINRKFLVVFAIIVFVLLNGIALYLLHFLDRPNNKSNTVTVSSASFTSAAANTDKKAVSFYANGTLRVGAGTTAYLDAATLPSSNIHYIYTSPLSTSANAATSILSYYFPTEDQSTITTMTVNADKTITIAAASSDNTVASKRIRGIATLSATQAVFLEVTSAGVVTVAPAAITSSSVSYLPSKRAAVATGSISNNIGMVSATSFVTVSYEPYSSTAAYYQFLTGGDVASDGTITLSTPLNFGDANSYLVTPSVATSFGNPVAVPEITGGFMITWWSSTTTSNKGICVYVGKYTSGALSKVVETCNSMYLPSTFVHATKVASGVYALAFYNGNNQNTLTIAMVQISSATSTVYFRGAYKYSDASGSFDFGSFYSWSPKPSLKMLSANRLAIAFFNPSSSGMPFTQVFQVTETFSLVPTTPLMRVSDGTFTLSGTSIASGTVTMDIIPASDESYVVGYAGVLGTVGVKRFSLIESWGKVAGLGSGSNGITMNGIATVDGSLTTGQMYFTTTGGNIVAATSTDPNANYFYAGANTIVSKDSRIGVAILNRRGVSMSPFVVHVAIKARGGAQLGKPVKGSSKDKKVKKDGKGGATEEEKRLADSINRLEMNDYLKKLAVSKKQQLKEYMEKEQKISKMNKLKIQNHWRKIMRLVKVEALRKEVEIKSQNHERDVDRKDAIIQMLDRDLEEAEEQYQMALRSHLLNVDQLIDLQDGRLLALENEFEKDLQILEKEFSIEKEKINKQHQMEKHELLNIMRAVEAQEKEREGEARQEHEQLREEIRNKNLEDINVLRITLDSNIEELEQHFETAHLNYLQNTDQRTQDFKYLTAKDQELSKDIEIKIRKIERLQSNLTHWRTKIAQNVRECTERNKALEEEKAQISSHFQQLKAKMNHMRDEHRKRLTELSHSARATKLKLQEEQDLAERILKLGELARKLETEREQVLPFYHSTIEDEQQANDAVKSLKQEHQQLHPGQVEDISDIDPIENAKIRMLQPHGELNGEPVQEWEYMDLFWKRYNKALLDTMAVQKEKARYEQENRELQAVLKQYLDGISVNEQVMSSINPLFVVNGRLALNQPTAHDKNHTIVDANHMSIDSLFIMMPRWNRRVSEAPMQSTPSLHMTFRKSSEVTPIPASGHSSREPLSTNLAVSPSQPAFLPNNKSPPPQENIIRRISRALLGRTDGVAPSTQVPSSRRKSSLKVVTDYLSGSFRTSKSEIGSSRHVENGLDAFSIQKDLLIMADGSMDSDLPSKIFAKELVEHVTKLLILYMSSDEFKQDCPIIQHSNSIKNLVFNAIKVVRELPEYTASEQAAEASLSIAMVHRGASTPRLLSFTIGDTKTLVIRNGALFFESASLIHSFNTPACIASQSIQSFEKEVLFESVNLEPKDILLICSDGVTDNVYAHELIEMVGAAFPIGDCQSAAHNVVQLAIHNFENPLNAYSPFSMAASSELYRQIDTDPSMMAQYSAVIQKDTNIKFNPLTRTSCTFLGQHYELEVLAMLASVATGHSDDATVIIVTV
ncbi:hypothetical protein THRCLA_05598 [Thraustotheca clavata]|uniref:Dynein regulatory complex subunit 2 n=1 Tax=Thraustotheca clavata TaxID=74557 RepID=A0A1V9ZVH8_9STRA|nr:hypothetical protein THRCLA_05598 [Thraustotheca clavata]